MNALIQVTSNEQGSQVVSARELYDFLEAKKQFADWIKSRIEKYGLIENQDYTTFSLIGEKGRPSVEYALTLDVAKELAMVEGNAKGKEARQYFIECERVAKQAVAQPAPVQLSRKELALMVVQIEEEKEALERQLEEIKPKIEYADSVLNTDDCVVTTVIAAELGYSAIAFNKLLRDHGIQWKVDGVWVLTSKYVNKGYAQMRTHTYHDTANKLHARMYMVWTQSGREMLYHRFKQQRHLKPAA